MTQPRIVEATLVAPKGARFAIVASRFNHFVVDRLLEGAIDALARHGANMAKVVVVRVPGAWEVPVAVSRLVRGKKVDAIVALAAVIRGATPHFEYIAAEVAKGTAQAQQESGIPVAFGILTTDTIEQAIDRAGAKAGNKGWDAALAAIEMASLAEAMSAAGL